MEDHLAKIKPIFVNLSIISKGILMNWLYLNFKQMFEKYKQYNVKLYILLKRIFIYVLTFMYPMRTYIFFYISKNMNSLHALEVLVWSIFICVQYDFTVISQFSITYVICLNLATLSINIMMVHFIMLSSSIADVQ